MGQFSVETYSRPGSHLSGNQHAWERLISDIARRANVAHQLEVPV
jgi:hypothetical protein